MYLAAGRRTEAAGLLSLAVAMLATRMDHFGGALALPDASLAVFFLAGLWLRAAWAFPALLLLALGVDLLALALQGLGADCLSPAYPFLMAAYGALWSAGRRVRASAQDATPQSILAGGAIAVSLAAVLAFGISNLSWFAFSGHFDSAALGDYVGRTLPQAPRYVGVALAYALLGMAARWLLAAPQRPAGATSVR